MKIRRISSAVVVLAFAVLFLLLPGCGAGSRLAIDNGSASNGGVTVTLHHPETDESVWRGKARPMAALKEAYRKYWPSRDRAALATLADMEDMLQAEPTVIRVED